MPRPQSRTQILSIIGFVSAAVALLFFPIVFGPVAVALGIIGHVRGERLGKWAAVAGAAAMLIGMALGALLRATMSA
ncbi:hypothetical protein HII36_30580 [Nonomuraea sp. NN258]|uniref:hypothetical protein n=1 Tax=Nonomuraea antri TaxID=2730852 RepID=UPI001568A4D5|nr:hypothetical protein [Nonomuraea antri]NRQ36149.1 hypothetical protein [Nonomuraea antri]